MSFYNITFTLHKTKIDNTLILFAHIMMVLSKCLLPVELLLQVFDILQVDEVRVRDGQQLCGDGTVFPPASLVGQAEQVVHPDGGHLLGFKAASLMHELKADESIVDKLQPRSKIVFRLRIDGRETF